MAPSALWTFAHRALAPQFHGDPAGFVAALDGNAAPRYLEQMWSWAQGTARPPLSYELQRLANGTLVRMRFRDVRVTGEPWSIRFAIKNGAHARMFLLEHSEYASELAGVPQAIICESCADGVHRNWGTILAPEDEEGFESFVFATLRAAAAS